MNKSTAIALLIGKSVFGASLALGFFTSPAGNADPSAAPHIAAMDGSAFDRDVMSTAVNQDGCDITAQTPTLPVNRRVCGGAIKGVCVR